MNHAALFRAVLAPSERNSKPRTFGLTIALDTGLGPREAADLVAVSSAHVDYVKIAWGSSLITGHLDEKLDVYRQGGVAPLLGGTLFEYAFLRATDATTDVVEDQDIVSTTPTTSPRQLANISESFLRIPPRP